MEARKEIEEVNEEGKEETDESEEKAIDTEYAIEEADEKLQLRRPSVSSITLIYS